MKEGCIVGIACRETYVQQTVLLLVFWSKLVQISLVLFNFIWSLLSYHLWDDVCLSFELQSESFHCFFECSNHSCILPYSVQALCWSEVACVILILEINLLLNQMNHVVRSVTAAADLLKIIKKSSANNLTLMIIYNSTPTSCSQHSPGGRDVAVFADRLPTVYIPIMLFQVIILQFIK